jgi:hypothetical protein
MYVLQLEKALHYYTKKNLFTRKQVFKNHHNYTLTFHQVPSIDPLRLEIVLMHPLYQHP